MSSPPKQRRAFYHMENPPLELLIKCKGNDRKAHFALYKWCFEDLISICRRYYKQEDDLKSAVNTSFLKIIQSMETIVSKYDDMVFYHWMKKLTVNHIIDEFRKNKNYRETIDITEEREIIEKYDSTLDNSFELKDSVASIQAAIDSLPVMGKTVFNLYAIEGYKHEEIGVLLNISANTSKVHFFRARTKLQQLLKNEKTLMS